MSSKRRSLRRCTHCTLKTEEIIAPEDRVLVTSTPSGVLLDVAVQVPVRCQWCARVIGFRYGEGWTSFLHSIRTLAHRCSEDIPPPPPVEGAGTASLVIPPPDRVLRRYINPARRGNLDAKVLAYCVTHDAALTQKDMERGGCRECLAAARFARGVYQEQLLARSRSTMFPFTVETGTGIPKPAGRQGQLPVYLVPANLQCRCGAVEFWDYVSVVLDMFDTAGVPKTEEAKEEST